MRASACERVLETILLCSNSCNERGLSAQWQSKVILKEKNLICKRGAAFTWWKNKKQIRNNWRKTLGCQFWSKCVSKRWDAKCDKTILFKNKWRTLYKKNWPWFPLLIFSSSSQRNYNCWRGTKSCNFLIFFSPRFNKTHFCWIVIIHLRRLRGLIY